jgi:hypothetical protein
VHVFLCWCVCLCVFVCVCVCVCVPSICVRENLYLHFLNFVCVCACNKEAVVTLPPRSTRTIQPAVAGCRFVGCSVVSGRSLRSRAVAGVSQQSVHIKSCSRVGGIVEDMCYARWNYHLTDGDRSTLTIRSPSFPRRCLSLSSSSPLSPLQCCPSHGLHIHSHGSRGPQTENP